MPEGMEHGINMTRDEVMKLISDSIGRSVEDAVKPFKERNNYTRELVDAIRDMSAGGGSDKKAETGDAWRFIRAACASRARSNEEVIAFVRDQWKDAACAKRLEGVVERTLSAGVAAAGGVLLPTELANEVIELLRAREVVRQLGATMVDMPEGSIEIPKQTGTAAVGFVGENQARNATEPTFGNIVLTAKKLIGIVPASNDLLRSPRANADSIIRRDLSRGMALREDLAFIRDDGTSATPKGMRHWAGTTTASAGTSTANVIADLQGLLTRMQQNDVDLMDAAWIMAPRSREHLRFIRGTDVFLFRDDIDRGRLLGLPVGVTSQIPTNLGGGGNESEIYLVNMADAIIGETGDMEVAASSEAAYHDASGTVTAPFSRDQTVIRVLERIDFAMRHAESVEVLTGVTWGS